jgi:hypothetical protein
MIELPGVEARQTHEVQCVWVMIVKRQGLPAAKLGIQISSGPQMTASSIIQRRDGVPILRLARFGLVGGRSAFTTVHRLLSA